MTIECKLKLTELPGVLFPQGHAVFKYDKIVEVGSLIFGFVILMKWMGIDSFCY